MRNTTTLFLVAFATVLSTLTSSATAQLPSQTWCQDYMSACEDLRKSNCDSKVPNNDRNLTWVTAHCSGSISSTGECRYFSPACSCSYTNVADMNRTVVVPLDKPALELTMAQTKIVCVDANANSTSVPPTATATRTSSGAPSTASNTASNTPSSTTAPNMAAGDNKKPLAVSLATINVAILIALFL
ncbi:hypothetical protein BGZ97_011127 [Linnemannia gamsii]|uniref:Secreted protein n=1 Tax=Linnemannia gamsii TaxID=64522 RepID=A0A9P6R6W4_9FUNG|nr:hypothetical protein BGZ97_011127 [Linnemannia gamsii]